MPPNVIITSLQRKHRIPQRKLEKLVAHIFGRKTVEISLVFTNNRRIRVCNRDFLGHDYPTDVIAFDLSDDNEKSTLFELYVSAEYAAQSAKKLKISYQEELCRYVVHGILHCLGYKDDTEANRTKMWKKQEKLLKSLLAKK